MKTSELEKKFSDLLNCESRENDSNTPDYMLAEFMVKCLEAFELTSNKREVWYGIELEPGGINIPKEKLKELEAIKDTEIIKKAPEEWDCNSYNFGFANGVIRVLAALKGEAPQFLASPPIEKAKETEAVE